MLKREKEFFQYMLDNEEEVIKALEKHYRDALSDINMSIRIMQADKLTQSKVYQLQYQQALKKQVEGILERLHAKEYTTIQQYLSDSYTNGFVGSMYSMHGQGIPMIATVDQNAAVKAVITDSQIREGLYDHLAVGVDGMKKAIREELTRGIASNMDYEDIARNIAYATKASLANTKNIVRTEGHRIQQASADDARHYAASRGADMLKQWDATLDGNTRKSHRELDGTLVELDEFFVIGTKKARYPGDFGDPAQDCQCRCVALDRPRWALDEAELEALKERAAFFKLDKTESFEDFKKKYLETTKELPENHGFIEAKTIEEATKFAKKAGVKHVYYNDMPLPMANMMNQALLTLPENARPEFVGMSKDIERISRVPFSRSSKQYYGVSVEVMDMYFGNGVYDFDGGNMVGISSYYKTADKITKAKKTAQKSYEEKYGRKWFFNENGESTPFHEMGHAYANKIGIPQGFEDDAMRWAKESGCDMLKKTSEAWAEAWGAYHTQNPALPDYIRKYIQSASAFNGGNTAVKGLIKYDENGIIRKKIQEFTNDLKAGKISTLISPQKQARHMYGSKEYLAYTARLAQNGDKPAYIRKELTTKDLSEMVKDKLGTGIIEVKNDNSIQEFFDCNEIVGYWYDKTNGKYVPTKRVQVKYSTANGNIHIIPVKEQK